MTDFTKYATRSLNKFLSYFFSNKSTHNQKDTALNVSNQQNFAIFYVPIYMCGKSASIKIEDCFAGKCNGQLLNQIDKVRALPQNIPPFNDLYSASRFLLFHWESREQARYILIMSVPKEESLRLLKETKDFHKKIIGAIDHEELIRYLSYNERGELSLPDNYKGINVFKLEGYLTNHSHLHNQSLSKMR